MTAPEKPQELGGLMWQIHELKQQLADAEKRGAVKALRTEAMRGLDAAKAAGQRESEFTDFAVHLMTGLAQELARRADVIESGQVTL